MFRNLTTGQWITFFILTLFTILGGFLYVAVEAHFNRADRASGALPARAAVAAEPVKTDPFIILVILTALVGFAVVKCLL